MIDQSSTPSIPLLGRILSEGSPRFWLIGVGICVLGVGLRAVTGPLLIDDAYIYFRYALNAASGRGLVYNPGQMVFGATSPIYTFILTLGAIAGLNLIHASVLLGVALDFISAMLLLAIGKKLGTDLTGWLSALLVSLAPKAVIPSLSGMETSLFTLLITLCLACLVYQQAGAAIILAGIAGATRPEGLALLGVVVVYVALQERRVRFRESFLAATPILLWLVISRIFYREWIPNSIRAKAVVFPGFPNPLHDSVLIMRYISNPFEFTSTIPELGWMNLAILCVGGIGLIHVIRGSKAIRPFVIWSVIIGAAYAVVNRSMFPWYLGPFFPLSALALAVALGRFTDSDQLHAWLDRSLPHAAGVVRASILAVFGFMLSASSIAAGRVVRQDQDHREAVYLRMGEWFSDHLRPDEVVASVEIGAISYGYRGPVLDLTGLVSPEVLPFYADPQFQFHYPHTLPPEAVEQLAPPVLVTYDKAIADMRETSWFQRAYPNIRIVETPHPVYGTLMVFTASGVPLPPP